MMSAFSLPGIRMSCLVHLAAVLRFAVAVPSSGLAGKIEKYVPGTSSWVLATATRRPWAPAPVLAIAMPV